MATTDTQTFELPGFGGELIRPGDAAYDEARTVFNPMIDRRPVLVARCASTDDVVTAVKAARQRHEHRVHTRDRDGDEAVHDRPGVPELHR